MFKEVHILIKKQYSRDLHFVICEQLFTNHISAYYLVCEVIGAHVIEPKPAGFGCITA